MKISVISFTETGMGLSERLPELIDAECELFTKCSTGTDRVSAIAEKIPYVKECISDWAGEQMRQRKALLFIGACGIAVRAIAPHVTDKLHDSPVLVMDEGGGYVIPILSGHVGGANELAGQIAQKTGAVAVITTATDLHQLFAVDIFAKKNNLFIENKEGIARVSAKLLAGEEITMSVERGHLLPDSVLPEQIRIISYPPAEAVDVLIASQPEREAVLVLRPKEYIIGMGCRRGKEAEKIEAFVLRSLECAGIKIQQVAALATIDIKSREEGLLTWCRKERVPFLTYTAKELNEVSGRFQTSAFVEEKVGTDNVCERSALRACGENGKLVYEKHAEDGMTIAIAKQVWSVTFDET